MVTRYAMRLIELSEERKRREANLLSPRYLKIRRRKASTLDKMLRLSPTGRVRACRLNEQGENDWQFDK